MIMMIWQVTEMMTNMQIDALTESDKQRVIALQDESVFGENLWNYYQFISWARWLTKK